MTESATVKLLSLKTNLALMQIVATCTVFVAIQEQFYYMQRILQR